MSSRTTNVISRQGRASRPWPPGAFQRRADRPLADTSGEEVGPGRSLVLRLGCSAPNRLADRAGRYRRLAVASALLPIPLLAMALVIAVQESSRPYAAGHVVLAGACGWLAVDLVRRGSVLDRREMPLASALAVVAGLALLANLRPEGSVARFGPTAVVAPTLVGLVVAFGALVVAERSADCLLSVLGRWILAAGVAALGATELAQTVVVFDDSRVYAAGLGLVASLLVLMGYFEARVLLRGLALARLASRH